MFHVMWKKAPSKYLGALGIINTYASYVREKQDITLNGIKTSLTIEFAEVILGGTIAIPAAVVFFGLAETQVVAGTDARLRATVKERVVSPAKGSVEREALERELQAAGVWDEVAALEPLALEKAVAEGKWEPEILERIKAYVSTEKRYTVMLKEET